MWSSWWNARRARARETPNWTGEPPTSETPCDDPTLDCWYSEREFCFCSPCQSSVRSFCLVPDPEPSWGCVQAADPCPVLMPQAGTPCAADSELGCATGCGTIAYCRDGIWQWLAISCPCVSPHTQIATPTGSRPIAELAVGDLVYSEHAAAIVPVVVARVHRTPVTRHRILRFTLNNGETLDVSAGHPTLDGRPSRELHVGDWMDEGTRIVARDSVPYGFAHTYDILPASDSGTYFVNGVRIGSTLR